MKNVNYMLFAAVMMFGTAANAQNQITISADQELSKIDRHIYGHFADEYNWMDGIGPRDERPARFQSRIFAATEFFA